ncbi:beta-galactosidase [Dactylosporangium matsuzakiense]|uniref:Beta-galactosidase n=1 Tax=Dactylosporangium matsuzakiense TaxID=53360 RepID=A0A9W6KVN0_9ACTN|nr:beta-galactosidase [Dactylosporangium matsuzakiense]GLL08047.1 beta-galactosidase [Dactylosporangium matsuzakiense]
MQPRTTPTVHRIRPADPKPLLRPSMSNDVGRHDRVLLTSRHLLIDGHPAIPVSGELHFSRIPRARWAERLRLLRASGVTVVASYVFWIHHEEHEGTARFDDNLDIAEFVRLAEAAGLFVVLRIGPWCHGETRNGGLPDWVLETAGEVRTDNPGYLALVERWFTALGDQLAPLCGPASPIIGIQIENELYDQPGHILTLKKAASAAGMTAPLWTATAWGGADLPPHEVLPLYGGYSDGFWVDADAPWDDTFRAHFLFSHRWDDPGIGADLRAIAAASRPPDPQFPPATCELGGGMATAYHRRPVPQPDDIAAIANIKIGNGSGWQGFYMYAGGVNPPGAAGLQESHRTGYPNDLPRFDYDFHAPVRASGDAGPTLPALREHNAFLEAFGAALAEMPSSLPDQMPVDAHDRTTLRWALRGNADCGFVFINWHQPHEPLDDHEPLQFLIEGRPDLWFPDEPVAIPTGTIARWPIGLSVGGVRIRWATASVVTLLDGTVPTLVLRAHAGIAARVAIDGQQQELTPGACRRISTAGGLLDLLLLDESDLALMWVIDGRLLRTAATIWSDGDGLQARSSVRPKVEVWRPELARFAPIEATGNPAARGDTPVELTAIRPPSQPPGSYGTHGGRASAPCQTDIDSVAAVFAVHLPHRRWAPEDDLVLIVEWAGDVAQLRADGRPVADRFWDGTPWHIELISLNIGPDSSLTLHITPLPGDARIGFDPAVESIPRGRAPAARARLEHRTLWILPRSGDLAV